MCVMSQGCWAQPRCSLATPFIKLRSIPSAIWHCLSTMRCSCHRNIWSWQSQLVSGSSGTANNLGAKVYTYFYSFWLQGMAFSKEVKVLYYFFLLNPWEEHGGKHHILTCQVDKETKWLTLITYWIIEGARMTTAWLLNSSSASNTQDQ